MIVNFVGITLTLSLQSFDAVNATKGNEMDEFLSDIVTGCPQGRRRNIAGHEYPLSIIGLWSGIVLALLTSFHRSHVALPPPSTFLYVFRTGEQFLPLVQALQTLNLISIICIVLSLIFSGRRN